ncbi:MAG: hypothetical protein Kow0010_14550 [Dehalococcoidia bacterium]
MEAVGIACQLAKKQKGRVTVLHVIEVGRELPLTAEMDTEARRGEQLLQRAFEVAHDARYAVELELLQARAAGQAIVEAATERRVEVVIMGIEQKSLAGESPIGRTADYVLKHAPCRVWILRQALTGPE